MYPYKMSPAATIAGPQLLTVHSVSMNGAKNKAGEIEFQFQMNSKVQCLGIA